MSHLPEIYARIDAAKAELDALRPLDREREQRVMQKFRLWWTYHSNAIEGNKLTQGETEIFLMEGLTAKGKPLKDHLDLRGHNEAINFLLSFIRDKREISEADIRSLHKILLVEPYQVDAITAEGVRTKKRVEIGTYKGSANHVLTRTGEIHYYATPEETPAKMHELMTWYREEKAKGIMHPVKLAALYHHRFTTIHPFDDGNGRMSRLLMNLMLMEAGYPPAVIRIGERDQYLAALRRADRDECDDFIQLICEHVLASLEVFIQAAKGQEVSEPTDLRKEIALELLRLEHIEEPVARSREVLLALYQGSMQALVTEAVSELSPFCEFFTESRISFYTNIVRPGFSTTVQHLTSFGEADFAAHVAECFQDGNMPGGTRLSVELSGFRKGRFETFNLSSCLSLDLEPLKYSVRVQAKQAFPPVLHFYQETLTKDEIASLIIPISQFFLEVIREKTRTS